MRTDDLGDPVASGTPSADSPAPAPSGSAAHTGSARTGRLRRVLPGIVVPGILILLAGALFVVDRSAPAAAGGNAARYLPPDGHSARYRDSQGIVDAVEHARLVGVEGVFTAPDAVASAVLGSMGESGVTGAQLWRETLTTADGSQYSDLYLVDQHGVSEVAAWGGPIGFTFDPALPLLPADVAPGDEWTGSGSAFGDGVLTYRAEYRAGDPPASMPTGDGGTFEVPAGCLQVDGSLHIDHPESGPLLESIGTSIWCPGQGRVFTTGSQNGEPVQSVLTEPGTALAPAAPPPAGTEADGTATDGTATDDTEAGDIPAPVPGDVTQLDATMVDPFFGESVRVGAVSVRPAVSGSGLVVLANDRGDDLQAWRLGDSRATLEWAAHPGGVLVAIATVGDLTLAATSDRAVHAYDAIGRRLWSWHGEELTLAPPVAASEHDPEPVVAARDGRMARLGAADGTPRWVSDLGADTRGAILIAGDVLVAADERGRLSGLDRDTGQLLWRNDTGMVDALAADPGGTTVYAATFDNDILALDPRTGVARWDDGFTGVLRSLNAAPDGVVVTTDEETVGYAADGAELWQASGADAVTLVGEAPRAGWTVSVRGAAAQLRTGDGEVSREWVLPDEARPDDGHIVADGEDLVLIDTSLQFWRMEGG